ncbi:MAG: NAD-dependent epimerase/dehydratase family protein [Rhodobacterales bacterium]|nr:NAD-dependent epimerase/dehydratase family protein [Rhodobacterales bacterium]
MRQTVLVTGSSGYIAKHIVVKLLNAGYTVRGTLRDVTRAVEVSNAVRPHLNEPSLLAQLDFVVLDLEQSEGWDAALKGVDILMHTASPFPIAQPKDEDDLIRPALEGTLRALRAAKAAGVRRVVVTSSSAAVMGGDLPAGKEAYDETCWTDVNYPGVTPYTKSKTLAEEAAWAYVKSEAPDMQLTTINPVLVIGPPLDRHFGTSVSVVERVLRAKDPMLPHVGFTCVDVRDIAEMHLRALTQEGTIGQRFIGSERFMWFVDIANELKSAFPDRRIVTRQAPDFVIRLLGLFDKAIGTIIPILGRRDEVNADKARRILGMSFRQAPQSLKETAQFLIDNKLV